LVQEVPVYPEATPLAEVTTSEDLMEETVRLVVLAVPE
jgi:hypothetical protein